MSQARVVTHIQDVGASQAPVANEPVNQSFAKETLVANPAIEFKVSGEERSKFYTGQDRLTLQSYNIQRVRELQELNDNLQREIVKKEREVLNASDPLSILADMEHCRIMIARNTGEILKIYLQNEERLNRIAQLEAENVRLKEEIIEMRDKFIHTHDMQLRTKHAVDFFLIKAKIEKNIAELYDLNQL
jgi:hypothetical protein